MKRWVMLFGVGFMLGVLPSGVKAEEAVLNNPPAAVSLLKAVIDKANPSYETFWNWDSGRFSQAVSISLYTITSSELPLASVRLGYGTNEILYGGVGLDLPGLSRRYVPGSLKGVLTAAPLDAFWSVVGKYGRISGVGGYSFAENEPAYGLTVGAAVSF